MKRIAMLIAAAALLNACGGGSDQAEPQASAQATAKATSKASLGAAATAASGSAQASSPASGSESGELWLVELAGAPEADGNSASSVTAEKEAFRRAAADAGVRYTERRSFGVLFNGFSVRATPAERAKLAKLPGFKAMYPVLLIQAPARPEVGGGSAPDLAAAIALTGANIAQANGYTGNGVKVGVIDTGVDIDHPDLGGGGVPDGTPFPTARIVHGFDFVGDDFNADPASPAFNPVPVPDARPDDCNGHGTHVAGIVGANGTVKGVAPGVTFGAYRVFGCDGSTTSDIMIEAMERAYGDRMDIINMSIGAARQWPQYPTAQAASRLVKKGVIVVASIGNNGPGGSAPDGLYSAGAPGVGELVIGVASFDNAQITQIAFRVDSTLYGYTQAAGSPPAPTSGQLQLDRTGTPTTANDACNPLAPASLMGKAVLIRRGTCSFYQKSFNAQAAGAAAVVLYNSVAGPLNPTVAGAPPITIPVVALSDTQGIALDARIAASPPPAVLVWTNEVATTPLPTGGLISGFSSFGLAADLSIKPNIGAPGGFIYSTIPLEQGGHGNNSGTSMSSPHVAGAAALVLQAKPKTKARDMKGVLQNSAVPKNWSGNPALGFLDHVHRQGAGMVNIPASIDAAVSVEPSEIALGESQGGPFTQKLTIDNDSRSSVTYQITHVPALATGPSTFLPLSVFFAPATVAFDTTTITISRRSKGHVNVTITAPDGLADKSIYGGYIVLTPSDGSAPLRVPFAGFKGDYQSIQVLTPTQFGFPWLAKLSEGFFFNQPQGATFTMVGEDIAFILLHLDHQAELVKLEAFNVATGDFVGNVSIDEFVPRNSTVSGFFDFPWDGEVFKGQKAKNFRPVPNGEYVIRVTVKKALGRDVDPTHFETWDSPVITIARPPQP